MAKLLKKLFRCPPDRDLIMVWREVIGEYAFGQTETSTKIYIGRYVVMRWTTFNRPPIGDDY